MNKVDQLRRMLAQAGCVLEVVCAPADAQTFDKMLVIFADSKKKVIRRVSLYDSRKDAIIGDY